MKRSILIGLVVIVLMILGIWVAFSPYGWTIPIQEVTLLDRVVPALFISILGSIGIALVFYEAGKEAVKP